MNVFHRAIATVQGLWVLRRMDLAPPAAGSTSGVHAHDSAGEPLSLAVLGDSTAAGCGVDTHEHGFTGAMARLLSERSGRAVRWQVVGQHGATSRRIRHRLLPQVEGPLDVVVVLAGGNDVLAGRSPAEWSEDLEAVVRQLTDVSGSVVVTAIPPFETFPTLPRTLARELAERGRALNRASRAVCADVGGVSFVDADARLVDDDFFSVDGFHPNAHGYEKWAETVIAAVPDLGNVRGR